MFFENIQIRKHQKLQLLALLGLKVQITTPADDILVFFLYFYRENKFDTNERQPE